jgi:hypothetical protein
MENQTPINRNIVEKRTGLPLAEYLQKCIERLESLNDKGLLQGMGELMDSKIKKFVQSKMRSEVIKMLNFYKNFPIL